MESPKRFNQAAPYFSAVPGLQSFAAFGGPDLLAVIYCIFKVFHFQGGVAVGFAAD
jgi:hypothetical protein